MGAIMSAMSPSARPTTERHTTPAASRILYGLIYRNRRPNSSRFVKESFDPPRLPPVPPALVRYESRARLSSRRSRGYWVLWSSTKTDARPRTGRPLQRQSPPLRDAFVAAAPSRVLRDGAGILHFKLAHYPAEPIFSLLGEVAMHDLGRVPAAVQRFVHRFRQHDRTMTSPGASKGDRQVALPFPDIVRNQISQQTFDAPQELSGLRKGADITRSEERRVGKEGRA